MNTIKLTKAVCISLLILIAATTNCRASRDEGRDEKPVEARLSIAGVAPGMSGDDVVRLLGQPLRIEKSDGFIVSQYFYSGLTLGFDEVDSVAFIQATAQSKCMLSKICLGVGIASIVKELSDSNVSYSLVDGVVIVNGDGCWGQIKFASDVASDVRVLCSP